MRFNIKRLFIAGLAILLLPADGATLRASGTDRSPPKRPSPLAAELEFQLKSHFRGLFSSPLPDLIQGTFDDLTGRVLVKGLYDILGLVEQQQQRERLLERQLYKVKKVTICYWPTEQTLTDAESISVLANARNDSVIRSYWNGNPTTNVTLWYTTEDGKFIHCDAYLHDNGIEIVIDDGKFLWLDTSKSRQPEALQKMVRSFIEEARESAKAWKKHSTSRPAH